MERETIEKIEELAIAASTPNFQVPGVAGFYLKQADGRLEYNRFELEPITKIICGDLATLMTLMNNAQTAGLTNLSVFVSSEKIVGIAEDNVNQRRFTYVLPLPLHPIAKLLNQHLATRHYDKKSFDTLLRAELAGTINPDIALIARDIKVSTQGETESKNTGGGNATLKVSMVAQVESGGKKLPNSFTIKTPIYDIEESRECKQGIDVLLETETVGTEVVFSVTTIHDSFESAKLETMRYLQSLLAGADYSVYLGSF
jgi:hypothetical protein